VPLVAVLLLVTAAACHSAWNLILKSESQRAEVSLGAIVVGTVLTAPVLAVHSVREIPLEGWLLIALSGVFETAYVITLTAAYNAGDLSLVYPIARGTPALIIAPLSVALLGERLSSLGVVAIALVVVGILATGQSGGDGDPAATRRSQGRAVGFAILTGLMIAVYSFVNKLGVQQVPVPLYAAMVFAADAVLLAIVLRARGLRWPRLPWTRWKPTLAVGILMMGSYMGVLGAMTRAPLAYVVAGRELSIVFTTIAGVILLGERITARRIGGASLIFAGLVVIALSR
jgi:drug/metabolite transporter (DMT)-like permease